jgi:hypothetical protein
MTAMMIIKYRYKSNKLENVNTFDDVFMINDMYEYII